MESSVVVFNIDDFKELVYQTVREAMNEVESRNIPKEAESGFLTRKEAAQYLKITLPTLRKHTMDGVIRCHEIGSRVLYRKSDLESAVTSPRFLKDQK